MNKGSFDSVIGRIVVEDDGSFITRVYVDNAFIGSGDNSRLFIAVKTQLEEYFCGKRREFDIPIRLNGTEFQKAVWNALLTVPYGKIASYKDIAAMIGKPKAARAVGGANNKNPIIIIVPCHRVVGADGSLTGYACGTDIKQTLLNIEKNSVDN